MDTNQSAPVIPQNNVPPTADQVHAALLELHPATLAAALAKLQTSPQVPAATPEPALRDPNANPDAAVPETPAPSAAPAPAPIEVPAETPAPPVPSAAPDVAAAQPGLSASPDVTAGPNASSDADSGKAPAKSDALETPETPETPATPETPETPEEWIAPDQRPGWCS